MDIDVRAEKHFHERFLVHHPEEADSVFRSPYSGLFLKDFHYVGFRTYPCHIPSDINAVSLERGGCLQYQVNPFVWYG